MVEAVREWPGSGQPKRHPCRRKVVLEMPSAGKNYHWSRFCELTFVGFFPISFFFPLGSTRGMGNDGGLRRWADLGLNQTPFTPLCDLGFPNISKQMFPNISEPQFSHLFIRDKKKKIPRIVWIDN